MKLYTLNTFDAAERL